MINSVISVKSYNIQLRKRSNFKDFKHRNSIKSKIRTCRRFRVLRSLKDVRDRIKSGSSDDFHFLSRCVSKNVGASQPNPCDGQCHFTLCLVSQLGEPILPKSKYWMQKCWLSISTHVAQIKISVSPSFVTNVFKGISWTMEVEGTEKLLRRSETARNVRYKYNLGDGDSLVTFIWWGM